MQRLKSNFFLSLLFILIIELLVLTEGVWLLLKGRGYMPLIGLLFCFVVVPLAQNLWSLFKFLKGRVYVYDTRSVVMNGGKLTFDAPTCPYEVWLFYKSPICRYYGNVHLFVENTPTNWIKEIPRRRPVPRSLRSDCTPVVLGPQSPQVGSSDKCRLEFHLQSAVENSSLNTLFPAEDAVLVTMMVKSV